MIAVAISLTANASPCEEYLKSFEKQNIKLGELSVWASKDPRGEIFVQSRMRTVLAGMELNLQLMQMRKCNNIPDYGIEVLAYEYSWKECFLALKDQLGYSEDSCSNPKMDPTKGDY